MDESPKQLIEESKPSQAMKPGQEARVDYEYIRHGVVSIFMVGEALAGKRLVEVTEEVKAWQWNRNNKAVRLIVSSLLRMQG